MLVCCLQLRRWPCWIIHWKVQSWDRLPSVWWTRTHRSSNYYFDSLGVEPNLTLCACLNNKLQVGKHLFHFIRIMSLTFTVKDSKTILSRLRRILLFGKVPLSENIRLINLESTAFHLYADVHDTSRLVFNKNITRDRHQNRTIKVLFNWNESCNNWIPKHLTVSSENCWYTFFDGPANKVLQEGKRQWLGSLQ